MELKRLNQRSSQNSRVTKKFLSLENLLDELSKREAPETVEQTINQEIEAVNTFSGSGKALLKQLRKSQNKIMKIAIKDLKVVPKHYYRNLWMALGMTVFGLPLGMALGFGVDNMGLLGVGLPIGMGIGLAVGMVLDDQAKAKGNQLNVDLEY